MPRNFEVKNILSYRVREAYNHRAMLDPSKALIPNELAQSLIQGAVPLQILTGQEGAATHLSSMALAI
jgi:hypothetical protein